ncbi:hypothetical protein F4803DRAFT_548844 [Xylaria telfairii]|nr:hypothetical protein F4803DRAFT_548844 [Xylaria telfairii]
MALAFAGFKSGVVSFCRGVVVGGATAPKQGQEGQEAQCMGSLAWPSPKVSPRVASAVQCLASAANQTSALVLWAGQQRQPMPDTRLITSDGNGSNAHGERWTAPFPPPPALAAA